MNATIIDNNTTFNELIRILSNRPEVEERTWEVQSQKAIDMFGEYTSVNGDELGPSAEDELEAALKKYARRPGSNQLRTSVPKIAEKKDGSCSRCEVFSNGYAIYDNGDRKTVLWVPDCSSFTYQFTALKDSELEYQKQESNIDEEMLGSLPWHCALMLAGEESIERNLSHLRSKGTVSDFDEEEWNSVFPATHWTCGAHFDGPEEAYLKKEAAETRRALFNSGRVHDIYCLYYEEGYNQREIGEMTGLDRHTVDTYLGRARKRMRREEKEKIFSEV